jgi:prepilin-type processing-associated H-X9-DG protein
MACRGVLPETFYAGRKDDIRDPGPRHYDLYRAYEKLLLCPATSPHTVSETALPWNGDTYRAWGETSGFKASYGMNLYMPVVEYPENPGHVSPERSQHAYYANPQTVWVSCLVKGAGSVPIYADCRWDGAWPRPTDPPPLSADAPYDLWTDVRPVPTPSHMWVFAMDRHQGGINSLFMDWSVRKAGVKELWTLKWDPQFDTAGPWTKAGGVQPDQWPKWMQKFKDY